jgi:carbonic anhydrase
MTRKRRSYWLIGYLFTLIVNVDALGLLYRYYSGQCYGPANETHTYRQTEALVLQETVLMKTPLLAVNWSYEGETGPQLWDKLHHDFMLCGKGQEQSPVNFISRPIPESRKESPITKKIDFSGWKKHTHAILWNNGNTIGVDIDYSNTTQYYSYFYYNHQSYILRQFHFHSPSEHHIEGSYFPLEAHFVHENPLTHKFLVLAIFFDYDTNFNSWLHHFWNQLPGRPINLSPTVRVEHVLKDTVLDLPQLARMLQIYHYETYQGSLTTPPCTEGVQWIVLFNPLPIHIHQLLHWRSLMSWNARPTQRNK